MSLLLWIPMNHDLRNQGIINSTITSNATVNDNGKLGKCYSFNGSSSYLIGTQNRISNSTDDWSYACWIKLNNTNAGQTLFSCRTSINQAGIAIFYYGANWYFDDGTRWIVTNSLVAGTWYHVCFVRKKGVGKYIYINGVLDKSTTATGTQSVVSTTNYSIGASQNTSTTVSSNYFYGYMNDCRFYNHALSVKEIKELFKGLVCHYKLDNTDHNQLVCDSSGYGYHGNPNGSLSMSNDSARYSKSTKFNSTSYISTSLVTSGYANSYTFSWWAKFTNTTNTMMWGFFNGNRLNLYMTSGGLFCWNTGDGSSNPFSGVTPSTYADNNWHHFAVTGNGTVVKLYIDGVYKSDSKTYKGITGTTLILNGWDLGTNYTFNGQLSDVRIYATSLSADDVRELYEVGASIDKNGNMYGYSISEDNTSVSRITKQGIINASKGDSSTNIGFVEDTNANILNNQFKANQFIEV